MRDNEENHHLGRVTGKENRRPCQNKTCLELSFVLVQNKIL